MAEKKKEKAKKAAAKTGKKAIAAPKPKKLRKEVAKKAAAKPSPKPKAAVKPALKKKAAKIAAKKVMVKRPLPKKAPPKKQPSRKPGVEKKAISKKKVEKHVAVKPVPVKEAAVKAKDVKTLIKGIEALIQPRTIAIWGANEKPGTIARIILDKILSVPFKGKVLPISQKKTILDLKAYSSLRKITGPVDVVIFAAKRDASRSALQECGRKKVKAVVVLFAGEAEEDVKGDDELRALAKTYGFRLLGPGTVGLGNTDNKVMLNATTLKSAIPPGTACLITDSGSIGETILHQAETKGLGISKFVSLGHKVDITENDCLEYFEKDPSTAYLMLYLRNFASSTIFVDKCKSISREKPITVLKPGGPISEGPTGKSALGSLSKVISPDRLIWEKCGIIPCDGLEDFINMGVVLGKMPVLPQGSRVGIITNGVGPGSVAKAGCIDHGLEVNPLQAKSLAGFPPAIQKSPKKTNPLNIPAGLGANGYWDALQAMIRDNGIDIIIPIFSPSRGFDDMEVAKVISKAWREMKSKRKYPKPVFPVWMVEKFGKGESATGILREVGLPLFKFPLEAVRVAGRFARYKRWTDKKEGAIPKFEVDVEKAERIISKAILEEREFLSDPEGQSLLECYGIPTVPTVVTGSLIAARKHAHKMGYPIVLKGMSDGLINKAEMKVVYLDIPVDRELVSTYQKIEGQMKRKWDKPFRIMMQPMVEPGVDLIISAVNSPDYNPMLLLGLGGGLVGAAYSIKLIPLTDTDGRDIIEGSAAYPVFKGSGGRTGLALDGLIELVLRFSQLIDTHREIAELDLDPLRAFPGGGFTVLDQMVRLTLPE